MYQSIKSMMSSRAKSWQICDSSPSHMTQVRNTGDFVFKLWTNHPATGETSFVQLYPMMLCIRMVENPICQKLTQLTQSQESEGNAIMFLYCFTKLLHMSKSALLVVLEHLWRVNQKCCSYFG